MTINPIAARLAGARLAGQLRAVETLKPHSHISDQTIALIELRRAAGPDAFDELVGWFIDVHSNGFTGPHNPRFDLMNALCHAFDAETAAEIAHLLSRCAGFTVALARARGA